MSNERRKYPRIELDGEVNMLIAGVVRNGALMNLSPSGIQIECRHQLIEQLARYKSDAGLFPKLELEFDLPKPVAGSKGVKSTCNVSYCRRLSQDNYHLGLNFVAMSETDEQKVSKYINCAA